MSRGEIIEDSEPILVPLQCTEPFLQQLRLLLVVPIFVQHAFWGCIGVDRYHPDHVWQQEEQDAIRTMAHSLGAAIERQHIEHQLRIERDQADTLREIGTILLSTLDVKDVLVRLLEQVRRVVPYDAANVFIIEDKLIRLVHRIVSTGQPEVPDDIRPTYHFRELPLLKPIMDGKQPLVVPDTLLDPRWAHIPQSSYIRSWMGIPVVVRNQVVGLVALDTCQANFYNESHIKILQPFVAQANQALENASLFADVRRLEKTKSEMIRMASHDLRNPLTRIGAIASQLANIPGIANDVHHARLLNLIQDAVDDIEHIVDNILSLERIEAKHRTAGPIHWQTLINSVVSALSPELEAKQHVLNITCQRELPPGYGDAEQIYHAIYNLLHNAIKYTPPRGKIDIHAFETTYADRPTIAIKIRDTGIGIPENEQRKLFDPFFRASNARKNELQGTGLGLHVVKEAVEYHQGRVYCTSTPGKGSTFGFWIPLEPEREL